MTHFTWNVILNRRERDLLNGLFQVPLSPSYKSLMFTVAFLTDPAEAEYSQSFTCFPALPDSTQNFTSFLELGANHSILSKSF